MLSQSALRQCNKLTCIQIYSNQLLSTGIFSLAFCRPLSARGTPDHGKETQNKVVWSCLPFITSGQNHLARHSERGKKTRQTEEEVGIQHKGMDRSGVRQVPEGSGEQGKIEETGGEIICGAPTTRLR